MKTGKPELSIIIPAYNEEKRIKKTLDEFSDFFSKHKIKYELVVMMDGCTDRTPQIVSEAAKKKINITFHSSKKKLGKGGAILEGFRVANGEYIAYTDADGATHPKEILRLLGMVGDSDGVIGSRWMKGSVLVRKQPLGRRIASRGFNLLTKLVLGLPYKDTQCPAKIFKGEVVRKIGKKLDVTNFAFDAALLYMTKKHGYDIKEVPIRWEDKNMSTVKMSKAILRMFWTVMKTRLG